MAWYNKTRKLNLINKIMGRPYLDDGLSSVVSTKFKPEQVMHLDTLRKKLGIKRSTLIRQIVTSYLQSLEVREAP